MFYILPMLVDITLYLRVLSNLVKLLRHFDGAVAGLQLLCSHHRWDFWNSKKGRNGRKKVEKSSEKAENDKTCSATPSIFYEGKSLKSQKSKFNQTTDQIRSDLDKNVLSSMTSKKRKVVYK